MLNDTMTSSVSIVTHHNEVIQEKDLQEENKTLEVSNLTWSKLLNHVPSNNIWIVDLDIDGLNSETILLAEKESKFSVVDLHLTKSNYKFVYANTLDEEIKVVRFNSLGKRYSGVCTHQTNDEFDLYSYVPFQGDKKVVCLFKKHEGLCYPISDVIVLHPSGELSIIEVKSEEPRNFSETIKEIDVVYCRHCSEKIAKIANKSETLGNLIHNLNIVLSKTVDPTYMIKILNLMSYLTYYKKQK